MNCRSCIAAAVLVLSGGVAAFAAAEPAAVDTVYLATVVDSSHVLPHSVSVPIRVRLDRLTADDRVAELVQVAQRQGESALQRSLQRESVGRLEINGRLGDPIAYARRIEDADGAHLLLIAERSISLREIFGNRRSVDYPFTVVEIDLAPDGAGGGLFYGAARLRPRRDGEIELDGLSLMPARLLGVKAVS